MQRRREMHQENARRKTQPASDPFAFQACRFFPCVFAALPRFVFALKTCISRTQDSFRQTKSSLLRFVPPLLLFVGLLSGEGAGLDGVSPHRTVVDAGSQSGLAAKRRKETQQQNCILEVESARGSWASRIPQIEETRKVNPCSASIGSVSTRIRGSTGLGSGCGAPAVPPYLFVFEVQSSPLA